MRGCLISTSFRYSPLIRKCQIQNIKTQHLMKVFLAFLLSFFSISFVQAQKSGQNNSDPATASQVLERVLGKSPENIKLNLVKQSVDQNDFYEYQVRNGNLIVNGSSKNALCRGVYDYLKNNHRGSLDWVGSNFKIPSKFPDAKLTKVTSPYKIRQAYNAVTPGYTTVFWNWERWQKELDWQAMHGFNMLMAPVATEAIATRVWKKLGLTQDEIDSFYVSPPLLPFQRMGCIQNVGGTLPQEWHKDQITLQHQILHRMKELDMQPIIQSFAGFVPRAIKRIYPDLTLHSTLWNAGFDPSKRPAMLMPGDPLFKRITKMYMEEWEKEFGHGKYFLVDSFNELELPKSERPMTEILADYGKFTFDAIQEANKDAVWVIQGWMFGYQRKQWPPQNVKALFSNVPDHKILILDYANDYANSWEPVDGFNGKQWAYGFVPNMGGKTAYTGDLSLYATGASKTLQSPKKNNLVGFSISGEGLENNYVIYELLTDVAWSQDPINLDNWIKDFSINRYGAYSASMKESWDLLRKSSYSYLIDHPSFNWQLGNFKVNNINRSNDFLKSVDLFLSCRKELGKSKNYQADAIERAALVLGLQAETCFEKAGKAYEKGDPLIGSKYGMKGLDILTALDRLMESHPLNKLERWVGFASAATNDKNLKQFYEESARRIVTVWGPPVNDYSCRVWSGLVRDFYRERMRLLLEAKKTGKPFDRSAWEEAWVLKSEISKIKPFKDPIETAVTLINNYKE